MAERVVTVDGVALCLEAFGDPSRPALLLISGMSASMDWWDAAFCGRLADAGRYVIRYDHRDTGRSASSPAGRPTYSTVDLTTDPLRVLDALGVERAHLVGLSMGGGIAQELAALHPGRVLSITLVATSAAGSRADPTPLPGSDPRIADAPAEPRWDDRAAVVDFLVENERLYGGTLAFDAARVRRVAEGVVDRTADVHAAVANHALAEGPAVAFRLADLDVPTLVLHGTSDPLFPLPHGRALAAEIPGATLVVLEGMGHEVPPPELWDVVVPAIVAHTGAPHP